MDPSGYQTQGLEEKVNSQGGVEGCDELNSSCQQREPGIGRLEGGPGSDQVTPPVDVDAIAGGLSPKRPILLHEVAHGLLDALVAVLLPCCRLAARTGRQQLRLGLYLPHGGKRGVAAAFRLFTLEAKGRGHVRNQDRAAIP